MKITTIHGEKRIRKRLGAKKSNADKRAEEAYYSGQTPKEFSGKFRKYLDAISVEHQTIPVVYKGNIFIFNPQTHMLVTCWPLAGH